MSQQRPLRIAQVSPLWTRVPPTTYGGIELLLKLLTDELVERGHDVTLFATGDCLTRAKLHEIAPVNLSELIERGEAYMFEYYATAVMTDVLRRAREFDVIHCHLSPAWIPLAALSPVPVVFTMHTSVHRDDEWVLDRYPEATVVGISGHQMRATSLRMNRDFPIVHNGCDFSAFDPDFEVGEYLAYPVSYTHLTLPTKA